MSDGRWECCGPMGGAGNDEGSVEDGRGWYGGWDTGLRVIGFRGREGGGGEAGTGNREGLFAVSGGWKVPGRVQWWWTCFRSILGPPRGGPRGRHVGVPKAVGGVVEEIVQPGALILSHSYNHRHVRPPAPPRLIVFLTCLPPPTHSSSTPLTPGMPASRIPTDVSHSPCMSPAKPSVCSRVMFLR